MCESIANPGQMRILICNDDGIDAQGLYLLEKIARTFSEDVWVVAPETEQSGASHSLTLHRPLRLRTRDTRHYTIDGTPSDCVLLAINRLLQDHKPDLVLAGINCGGNLGEDVHYSGTVAAAMEGTLLGIRALALSQVFTAPWPVRWDTAERFLPGILRAVIGGPWDRNVLLNVNFPDVDPDAVSGVAIVHQGKRKIGDYLEERVDPRGRPYIWISGQRREDRHKPGTDLEAICRGAITITPLVVDWTHVPTLEALQETFCAFQKDS
ncbi:5-nucleotidase SurE [invertebrate metagenome]|uniref:5'-nucleotidase n=1 Tax=invertebrate metagenome TaxID=1711999 RepID=A0A484HAC0_9ZZZZ